MKMKKNEQNRNNENKIKVEALQEESITGLYQTRLGQKIATNPVEDEDNVEDSWMKIKRDCM
jgi:hypothetical protein